METLGERLRYAREKANLTQKAVAAQFGIDRVNVSQWESDTTRPDQDRFPALAAMYDVKIDWLIGGSGEMLPPSPPTTFTPVIVPGKELVGDRNFPIYAAARGSSEGHQIVTFDAIDYVKRPAILESVKDAYGLYIEGESMIPAFEPGDMALVHPHLPPARDKNVVLYHVPPTSGAEAEAMVKRLIRFDERDWHLLQFNPPDGEEKEFRVLRDDWKFCHRIVGKYEAR